ncbi:MAG: SusF/SusE family outer membrane protein [Muribaculaceae bacterium]|nr:SusF/SusE family outer membrane protein [Muribaculaceae bacterium]
MKKFLRNLMLAGAAALLATGASAQTLEKAWTNSSVPGSQYGGQLRFNVGKDNKVLVTEMDQYKIVAFDAEGKTDYYDLKPAVDEHYGVDAKEISKIDTIVSETNDSTFDTTWVDVRKIPGVTPTLGMDEAGNILVATGTTGSWTPNFIIISADLKNTYKLEITLPEGASTGRVDQVGKIIGNMLSAEGAYIWLCPVGESAVTIKIVEGVQDMDYSQASAKTPYANSSSCIAQPALWTVAEIDALMDDNGSFDGSFYWRNRSYAASVYAYDAETLEWNAITVATGGASNEGLATFQLNGENYFVVPVVDDANARSAWFSVVKEDGTVVATAKDNHTGMSSFRSFYVEPIDETSVRIYNWVPAKEASVYTFTIPAEGPAADPLYIFGSFNSWTPAEGLELTYADGVYTIEDVEFGEGGNFGLSTVKSDNWDEVNANRYGFATDNAKAVVGENEIVKGAGAIQVPYAGVWDITVDIANLKLTLATETPEPTPEPEPVVIPEGLNKVWEVTTGVPGSASGGEFRFATARDGKILVTDKANKKIMAIDENGMAEEAIFDLAAAIDTHYGVDAKAIEKIDTIVSETNDSTFDTTWVDVRNVPGAGTGITVDDAGNILVGTDFPNAGSSTNLIIISADLKNSYKLQITLPEGVSAGRIDQYGKVVGDLLSETGAYLWLAINGQTKVAVIKVANGEQVEDYSQASENVDVAMNTSTLAQPALFTVEEIDALMDENGNLSASFWSRNRGSAQSMYGWNEEATKQVVLSLTENDANGVTTKGAGAEGFATFKLGDVTYFAVPMSLDGSARSAAIGVYDETGKLHATYVPEGIATGMGQMGSIAVEAINEEAVAIYRFIPGVFAGKYTFAPAKPFEGPAELYMVGHDNGWDPANPAVIAMTEEAGVYEANLTFDNTEFKFSEAKGTWDEFNAKAICIDGDKTVELNTPTALYKYADTNCKANVEKGKTYTVTIDLNNNTITIKEASGVEGIETEENAPAVYYNLQGVKVANPENGVYIKVQGNKASKVLVK